MGCFGYICKGCHTPINGDCLVGGEKCVLIHVRHGEETGRVEGHYDEYGRVSEQEFLPEEDRFRGYCKGPNGHRAVCDSEYSLEDSYYRLQGLRLYCGLEIKYIDFVVQKKRKMFADPIDPDPDSQWEALESSGIFEREYAALPIPRRDRYSGMVAWHSLCYKQASAQARADLTPSDTDPNQSWGRIRKKYK